MNDQHSLEKNNPIYVKRFLYGPSFIKSALAIIFFGGISALFLFDKEVGDSHWKYFKLIAYLGLDGHLVIKALGLLSLAMALCALANMIYTAISDRRYVILAKNSLHTPASHFNSKTHEVRFVDILNVNILDTMNQKIIRIEHKAGKIDLANAMFKNKHTFNECYAAILAAKQPA